MTIPTTQLETWSNPGADDSAMTTSHRVQNVLEADDSILQRKEKSFDSYLQGSYKNATNIYADSDVDLVVRLDSTFRRNLANLTGTEKQKYKQAYSTATYSWEDFHTDVVKILKNRYGTTAVTEDDRAVVLQSGSLPLTADIVVCLQYRRYSRFNSKRDQDYDQGIVFWDLSTDEQIISYPKIHYANGADKNQTVNGRYRETIRIFKNARSYLVKKGAIADDIAPSYYIECLLYNVPAENYVYDHQDRYGNVVNWLADAQLTGFQCQNEIQDLFGTRSTQWVQSDATEYLRHLIDLWNNWDEY